MIASRVSQPLIASVCRAGGWICVICSRAAMFNPNLQALSASVPVKIDKSDSPVERSRKVKGR